MEKKVGRSIYKRGEHQFRVRIKMHGKTLNQTFETQKKAELWRDSKLIQRRTDPDSKRIVGIEAEQKKRRDISTDDALARYRDEISKKKVSPDSEIYRLEAIRRSTLATIPFYSVQPDDIRQFLDELQAGKVTADRPGKKKGISDTTVLKYHAILSHLFTVARRRWGMALSSNPMDEVHKPRPGPGRQRRVTAKERALLFKALGDCDNPLMLPLAKLALWTGARQGSLLNLQWERIDWKSRSILFHGTKDAQGNLEVRVVPFDFVTGDNRVDKLLRELAGKKPINKLTGRIFKGLTSSGIPQAWDHARARAGIPDVCFHDLRHEATSQLFESGRWLDAEIMTGLGHKNFKTTLKYAHLKLLAKATKRRRPRK